MTIEPSFSPRWQFWVDRGGTFTDIVGRRPDGGLVSLPAYLIAGLPPHTPMR